MDRLLMFIATGGGSGYLPKAPGTWGSLVGLLIWLVIGRIPLPTYLCVIGALFVIGFFSAGAAEKIVDRADPALVVIDEIVGMLVALTAAPFHPVAGLAGLLIFRFFDIVKPFPINWLDRHLHGGLGIMVDDIAAGLASLIVLQLGLHFFPVA